MLLLAAALALGTPACGADAPACPDGTQAARLAERDGRLELCQRPDGSRHGPYALVDYAGQRRVVGQYVEGLATGPWRHFDAAGALVEVGEMAAGQRVGTWTSFGEGGSIVATVRWMALEPGGAAARRPTDSRQAWALSLGAPARQVVPLGDLVLVETAGRLRAVDLDSGQTRWSLALPAGLRAGFIADGQHIAAVTGPGELLIIDEAEGTAHRIRTDLGMTRATALVDGAVLVREGAGRFQSLEMKSGRSFWRGAVSFSELPAVAAGAVVVGTRGRDIRAAHKADGKAAWQARAAQEVIALATSFTGDQVFALDRGGELLALSARTGSPRWTLSLPELAGQGAGLALRDDAGSLVLLGVDRLLSVSHDGRVLGRLALPRQSAQGGDVLDDAACWTSRTGTLTCSSLSQGQDWTLDLGPLALPPVLLGDRLLAATGDGRLLAIDTTVAAISEEGEPVDSLVLDPALPLLLDPQPDAFGLSGQPATAPLLLVEKQAQDAQGACVVQQAVLDLGRLARGPSLDAAAEGQPSLLDIAIPDLQVDDSSLDLPATLDTARWSDQPLWQRWSLRYFLDWRPRLLELGTLGGDEGAAARVGRLSRCEAGPATFQGTARVQDGGVERRLSGRLSLVPHPQLLDGEPGCLIEIALADEPIGVFSGLDLPGFLELTISLEGQGIDPPQLAGGDLAGLPEGALHGLLGLHLDLPGEAYEDSLEGSFFLDLEASLDPSASEEPLDLRVFEGAVERLRLPVDGLRWGERIEDEAGQPTGLLRSEAHHDLRLRAPVDPRQQRLLPVWSATDCIAPDPLPEALPPLPDPAAALQPAP